MASFTERIAVIIDVSADKAVNSLKSFRSAVKDADGFSEKLKVGAKALGANANLLVGGAGAALVGMAIKGSAAMTRLAKSSLDLAKATGMSTEEASRWIAVADDAGISAETLQMSVGKIAKSLDSGKWEQYGIATRDAGGNVRDASAILADALGALSNVTNATDRARIGSDLFGKGFANLAPLLGHTSDEYRKLLGAVSEGQVITADEAAKTEKMRMAQDNLKDALRDVTLALGGVVVSGAPVINFFASLAEKAASIAGVVTGSDTKSTSGALNVVTKSLGAAGTSAAATLNAFSKFRHEVADSQSSLHKTGQVIDAMFDPSGGSKAAEAWSTAVNAIKQLSPQEQKQVTDAMEQLLAAADAGSQKARDWAHNTGLTTDSLHALQVELGQLQPVLMQNGDSNKESAQAAYLHGQEERRLADATDYAARHVQNLDTKLNKLSGNLNANDAIDAAMTALEGIGTASQEAWDKTAKGAPDAEQAQRDVAKAIRDTQQAVIDLENQDLITHPQAVEIQTAIDQGDYKRAKDLMDEITRPRTSYVNVVVNAGKAGGAGLLSPGQHYAAGTDFAPGGIALVGEQGPELVDLPRGSRVYNANRTRGMLGAGGSSQPIIVQLQLNDKTLQEIAIRTDDLKRGRT